MTSLIRIRGSVAGNVPNVPGRYPSPLTRSLCCFYTDECCWPCSATHSGFQLLRLCRYQRILIDSCLIPDGRGSHGVEGGTLADQSGCAVVSEMAITRLMDGRISGGG